MADVDTIDVQYNRKVQLEQFEPVQHGLSMEVSLDDGDDPDEVYDEYASIAEDMVERSLAERIARAKIDADDDEE